MDVFFLIRNKDFTDFSGQEKKLTFIFTFFLLTKEKNLCRDPLPIGLEYTVHHLICKKKIASVLQISSI